MHRHPTGGTRYDLYSPYVNCPHFRTVVYVLMWVIFHDIEIANKIHIGHSNNVTTVGLSVAALIQLYSVHISESSCRNVSIILRWVPSNCENFDFYSIHRVGNIRWTPTLSIIRLDAVIPGSPVPHNFGHWLTESNSTAVFYEQKIGTRSGPRTWDVFPTDKEPVCPVHWEDWHTTSTEKMVSQFESLAVIFAEGAEKTKNRNGWTFSRFKIYLRIWPWSLLCWIIMLCSTESIQR